MVYVMFLCSNYVMMYALYLYFLQELIYPIYFSAILAIIKFFTKLDPLPAVPASSLPVFGMNNITGLGLNLSQPLVAYPDTTEVKTFYSLW